MQVLAGETALDFLIPRRRLQAWLAPALQPERRSMKPSTYGRTLQYPNRRAMKSDCKWPRRMPTVNKQGGIRTGAAEVRSGNPMGAVRRCNP